MVTTFNLAPPKTFNLIEATVESITEAFEFGALTATELVELYTARIEAYDDIGPTLTAIISTNPNATAIAEELDQEFLAGDIRGPLHGIPIILKDNFDTFDVQTTAGALALEEFIPEEDAFQVEKLREAGAIILAKANLSEFAFAFTSESSLGGLTVNPYDTDRNAGGSSGGTGAALAANFGAIGFGTDTGGSIRVPSSYNSLVGIRPTIGLSSRSGIVPLALTQDVGGPMARTVTDAVLALDATVGFDPADPKTADSMGQIPETYTAFLDPDGLEGARIGIDRALLAEEDDDRAAATNAVIDQALADMEALGATVVEVSIPNLEEILSFPSLSTLEFKRDLNAYLAERDAPIGSLQDLIDSGEFLEDFEDTYIFRNDIDLTDPETAAEYERILTERPPLTQNSLNEVLDTNDLDALVYPTTQRPPNLLEEGTGAGSNNRLSPFSEFPAITVPAGFTEDGLNVNIEFLGRLFDEPTLINLAYSFEQGTMNRQAPESTPALPGETFSFQTEVLVVGNLEDDVVESTVTPNFDGIRDFVFTGLGEDLVDTTQTVTGNNRLYGGSGNDEIFVGLNDRAFGNDGDDILDATVGKGGNRLYGGDGNDTFFLGADDRAIGGAGDDQIFAVVGGDNILTGSSGADQFWIATSEIVEAANTITDFISGEDVIGVGGLGVSFEDLTITSNGDTTIALEGNDLAVLLGVDSVSETDFVFA